MTYTPPTQETRLGMALDHVETEVKRLIQEKDYGWRVAMPIALDNACYVFPTVDQDQLGRLVADSHIAKLAANARLN